MLKFKARKLVTSRDVAIEVIGVAQLEETNNEGQWGRLARIKNLFIYTFFWHERSALQSVARSTGSN